MCVDVDWVGSSRDRGLTESELHHAGWGHPNSRTVPAPNQEFVWESLPSATSCAEPETTTPELNIVQGVLGSDQAGHVALDQNTHSLDVSKLVLHPCAIDQVTSHLAQACPSLACHAPLLTIPVPKHPAPKFLWVGHMQPSGHVSRGAWEC